MMNLPTYNHREQSAYQQAGQAVMYYLILRVGVADESFLIRPSAVDRRLLLPEIADSITIDGEGTEWNRLTDSLKSLTTVAQVALAGYAAERIQFKRVEAIVPQNSRLIRLAHNLYGSYVDEIYREDVAQIDKVAQTILDKEYVNVEAKIRAHWQAVNAAANALLDATSLPKAEVFALIERALPAESQAQAAALAERAAHEREDEANRLKEQMVNLLVKGYTSLNCPGGEIELVVDYEDSCRIQKRSPDKNVMPSTAFTGTWTAQRSNQGVSLTLDFGNFQLRYRYNHQVSVSLGGHTRFIPGLDPDPMNAVDIFDPVSLLSKDELGNFRHEVHVRTEKKWWEFWK